MRASRRVLSIAHLNFWGGRENLVVELVVVDGVGQAGVLRRRRGLARADSRAHNRHLVLQCRLEGDLPRHWESRA